MYPCDKCGFMTDEVYIVDDGETGLCSQCAYIKDKEEN